MKIFKYVKITVLIFLGVLAFARYTETNYFHLFPMFDIQAYLLAVQSDVAAARCRDRADSETGAFGPATPAQRIDANQSAWRTCMDAHWAKVRTDNLAQ